ncbi:hypothetical protein DITRI_Ditri10aG0033800 [Diplodiscus trichospermus]
MPLSKPEKDITIKDDDDNNSPEDDKEEREKMDSVTTHLYIKQSHSKQAMDKEVVLRRIRHRKRMNNVKSTLLSFIGSSLPAKNDNKVSVQEIKWVDDAFAAL